jgi:hypothetical protein
MLPASTLPSVLGVLALIISALLLRKRSPLLSLGILWFFAGHLLESSVLPLELVFEHRNYLPLFGLLMGIVAAIGCSRHLQHHAKPLATLAALIFVIFSGLTALRATEWKSPPEFAESEARHHPLSPRAQYELGSVLMALAISGAPQFADPATAAMMRSRDLDRNSISEDIALAILNSVLKNPEAVAKHLGDAAERSGTIIPNVETQTSLQTVLKYANGDTALPFKETDAVFARVLANPHIGAIPCFTGGIWNTYGVYLQDNGMIPQSMSALHKALDLCPALTDVRVNYARNLIVYGDLNDARTQIGLIEAANTFGRYTPDLGQLQERLKVQEKQEAAHLP